MRIELYTAAKQALNDFTEKTGMTQVAAASRIIEWFILDAGEAQEVILGLVPKEILQDVAALLLKRKPSTKRN